mgnify:CR=1 FL=1|tara:strand:+ start:10036 stop:10788 length:753 start_codon:yes stop_codon:yes gene_type:complete
MKVGSITTDIIKNGLVFNMDAANRASYPKTGTTVTDTIGTINGTLQSSGMFENTNSGVFNFDGSTNYIVANSLASTMANASEGTFCLWVKPQGGNTNRNGVSFDDLNGNTTIQIAVHGRDNGSSPGSIYWFCRVSGTNQFIVTSENNVSVDNEWAYVCGVQTADTNAPLLYRNGQLLSATNSISTNNAYFFSSDTSNIIDGFSIGRYNSGYNPNENHFYGDMGSVHIYNRALSATEVLHNYNALKGRFGL